MKLRHEQGGEDGAAGDSPERAAARAFIAANLPAKPAPGLPEVSIHTATPASGLRRLVAGRNPYWAWCWAGGLALARHILAHPELVAGRRALDLGTGSGLVAIAAARAGAAHVLAVDSDADAVAAAEANAAANAVTIECGAQVLVGDPGRAFLPLDRLERIADYAARDFGDSGEGEGRAGVFSFRPRSV